jgi:hypothetical protein
MSGRSTLEKPDEEFLSQAITIKDQCTEHATEWKIDTERLSTLTTLITTAVTAYEANKDKAKHNLITSTNKQAAFAELKSFLSPFIDYLLGNLSVPDEALSIMGLRSRKRRVHDTLPRPDEAPVLRVVKKRDEMTVYVSRTEQGHPTRTAKKKGYHGFRLRWRFESETGYRMEISTRLKLTLHFESKDETKRVIMSAAWINPRLEEGPWSADRTEVVG